MTTMKRIAAQPPLPQPVPVTEHLSMQDQGPVLPVSRRDKLRAAQQRLGIVPMPTQPQGDDRG